MKATLKNIKITEDVKEYVSTLSGRMTKKGFRVSGTLSVPQRMWVQTRSDSRDVCFNEGEHQVSWFFPGDLGESFFCLQESVETPEYLDVTVASKWIALDIYGRKIECDTEEEAESEHRKFGKPQRINSYSAPELKENLSIINLTQHQATSEQAEAGIVEPASKGAVQAALTFDSLPASEEIQQRAKLVAAIAKESGSKKAMIGGAPFFMSALERALLDVGIEPVYAFSVRDSKEESDGNGGVRKVNVFRHVGFVSVT